MNTRNIMIALLTNAILFFVVFPSISSAQLAKDAIMALKKLDARTDVGISYEQYSPALGEAKFTVNVYLESKEARNNQELKDAIVTAMRCFDDAKDYWEFEIKSDGIIGMWPDTLKRYPEAEKPIRNGGASVNRWPFGRRLQVKALLPIVWRHASIELDRATEILKKIDTIQTDKKTSTESVELRLEKLNSLKEKGIINQEDYDIKKAEILSDL